MATTCTACSANAVENGVCARCGNVSGENHTCPHCGAVARIEPKGAGWVCGVCGGPRIPGGIGGDEAAMALREEKSALGAALRGKAATIAFAVAAGFFGLVTLAAWPHALVLKAILLVFTIVPMLMAMKSQSSASKASARAKEADEKAWMAAALQAARGGAGITAEELAKRLGVSPERADHLLTQLAVHDRTRIDVGDDAEVRYSVGPAEQLEEDTRDEGLKQMKSTR